MKPNPISFLFLLCASAALIPLRPSSVKTSSGVDAFPGWTAAPIPFGSANIPLGPREVRFAADFPGQIGAFTDGTRTSIVRWVRTPTRKLHPAADCLRALGYTMRSSPIFITSDGSRWGTSIAQRRGERFRVREQIVDADGREWTDISAWFWSAAFGKSVGPWWAVTIFEPSELKDSL
jgi:hypothetical protein